MALRLDALPPQLLREPGPRPLQARARDGRRNAEHLGGRSGGEPFPGDERQELAVSRIPAAAAA